MAVIHALTKTVTLIFIQNHLAVENSCDEYKIRVGKYNPIQVNLVDFSSVPEVFWTNTSAKNSDEVAHPCICL